MTDLARYLVGELREVTAAMETFVKRRPLEKRGGATKSRIARKVEVDDAVVMIGRFRGGGLASIEATDLRPAGRTASNWRSTAARAPSYSILRR